MVSMEEKSTTLYNFLVILNVVFMLLALMDESGHIQDVLQHKGDLTVVFKITIAIFWIGLEYRLAMIHLLLENLPEVQHHKKDPATSIN